MDITRITQNNREAFEGLMPEGFTERDDFLKSHGFVTCPEEDMYEVPVSDLIYTEQMDALIEKVTPCDSVHSLEEPKMYERLKSYLDSLGAGTEETESISRHWHPYARSPAINPYIRECQMSSSRKRLRMALSTWQISMNTGQLN